MESISIVEKMGPTMHFLKWLELSTHTRTPNSGKSVFPYQGDESGP